VVATQNVTDPRLGPIGLDLMARGATAIAALDALCQTAEHIAFRQLALVDCRGGTAVFSGARALGRHGAIAGDHVAVAGNLLASDAVLPAMRDAFATASREDLGDRLLAAMQAAVAAGGEAGPIHSAGMVLVDRVPWPVADLRIDWTDADPVAALAELWAIWQPQMDDYVTRALHPDAAPAFGVPGDRPPTG
jgi:uncharacterized Ntn-hydrolase superfamily protein